MSTVDQAVEAGARAVWMDFQADEGPTWAGYELAFRAGLAAAWPVLSAPLRELHRPFGIFELEDCCTDTTDEHREEHHHECADEYGEFYCDELLIGRVCDECRDGEGERVAHPCPTMQLIIETDKELGL